MAQTQSNSKTIQQLTDFVRALDDKKARDIQVARVGEVSSLTDYVVLATATSEPHLKALSAELAKTAKQAGIRVGVDYTPTSGWLVVDAFDFMVHVFLPAIRDAFRIDGLWRMAPQIDVPELLGQKRKEPAKPKTPAKKAATKKAAPKKVAAKKTPAKKSAKKSAPKTKAKPAAKKTAKKTTKTKR